MLAQLVKFLLIAVSKDRIANLQQTILALGDGFGEPLARRYLILTGTRLVEH